ncbi:subtilase-type protease inhibitor [Streptomyces sp. GC420]|uniref:subtilase-type protease inhibitor n=1 Tax=Streptomyces sp. GC420 TaxID=2697568 RepID=UPI001414F31B|nr:subtilase-type protease inhibitor [Streptomyces sp. GC420]NBM15985.1 protease inhibitor protein [Streptomyces sp. GC420]
MRTPARWAATGTLLTAAVLGPLHGTAAAESQSLYAPSALVLTVAHGEDAAGTSPERAVTLTCEPRTTGTHPSPRDACDQLAAADGDFGKLALTGQGKPGICTFQYDPVVVTAQGVWRGERVDYERTFGNDCVKNVEGAAVFAF